MNKEELVRRVAKVARKSQSDTSDVINALIDVVQRDINEEDISLQGIGKLTVRSRKSYQTFSPVVGKQVTVNSRKVVSFIASDKLKEIVNYAK